MFPALGAQRKTMADAGEGLNQAGVDVALWVPLRDRAQPVSCSLLAVGVLAWAGGATVFFRYPLFSSFDSPFWRQCRYHRRNAMLFSSMRRGHPIISIKPMRCGFRCEPGCRP
jgi:hypothetical protein